MAKVADIHWLAGLLEGDGCFFLAKRKVPTLAGHNVQYAPAIAASMTDLDVVQKVNRIWDGDFVAKPLKRINSTVLGTKPMFDSRIRGSKAVQWMMTLLPLMGNRRSEKIKSILKLWKASPFRASIPEEIYLGKNSDP